jgi:DNA-binding response OmpR family regulator
VVPAPRAQRRLLVVEDDPASAAAMRSLFEKRGWEVFAAGTLAEALAHLGAEPSWVILDLMLPDGDGEQILETIRESGSGTRVVVTTGVFDEQRLRALKDLAPHAVLIKPINVRELLRIVT